MLGGKGLLGRVAAGLSRYFGFPKARKRLGPAVEETQPDSLDQSFLATRSRRFREPPYASLRQ
jgi:hypothetical protein